MFYDVWILKTKGCSTGKTLTGEKCCGVCLYLKFHFWRLVCHTFLCRHCEDFEVVILVYSCFLCDKFMCTTLWMLKKNSDLVVSFEWTCPSLGLEVMTFDLVEYCLVSWSHPQTHVSSPVIIFKRNYGSYCSLSWRFWQLLTQFSCPRDAEDKFDVSPLHVCIFLKSGVKRPKWKLQHISSFMCNGSPVIKDSSFTNPYFRLFSYWSMSEAFSIFSRGHTTFELEKPLKNLHVAPFLLYEVYFQHFESPCIIFLQFKATFDDDMTLLQVFNSLGTGTPKLPMEWPTLVLNMAQYGALCGG